YLPDVDATLQERKGICFDYSALFAAMLRAQDIPVRLAIGYVQPDNIYHAWNQVYLDGEWVWMDSTFGPESAYTEENYTKERQY
ncbi:MAG: transglutaminase domain-containing protein, partial [Lachnospiraceae bacterium]|nr:transglutaminase domain-containing protein [Lachnospiraceae bacterium]